jgi:hypothetical protein
MRSECCSEAAESLAGRNFAERTKRFQAAYFALPEGLSSFHYAIAAADIGHFEYYLPLPARPSFFVTYISFQYFQPITATLSCRHADYIDADTFH